METGIKEIIKKELLKIHPELVIKEIDCSSMIFEDRVKLKCFQCKHYNNKPTCPPFDNDINFMKIIKSECSNILIFVLKKEIKDDFDEVRTATTNALHKILLHAEKILYDNNFSLATSFIGGSCKLCKEGCNKTKCNNPGLARIPMEAIGINVVKTLKVVDIDVVFPIEKNLSRYGMLIW